MQQASEGSHSNKQENKLSDGEKKLMVPGGERGGEG